MKAILALRQAQGAVRHFATVHSHTLEGDVVPLSDPSFDDLNGDIAGVEWNLTQALRLFDNCVPPPVALLTGGLERHEGESPVREEARLLLRQMAAEWLGEPDGAA